MKTINNELIRSFDPCYDPSEKGISDDETLSVQEWVAKYRGVVPAEDILWLLLRNEFYTDKQLRLFAVWCAREALKLIGNPDPRSVNACDTAERFANGEATEKELNAARVAAWGAARDAAWSAARAAAWGAARAAAWGAAWDAARGAANAAAWSAANAAAWSAANAAAWGAARDEQLNYLLKNEQI